MWHLEEELIDWFDELKERREEEGGGGRDDDDDGEHRRRKPDRVVPTERNQLAKGRGRDS